MNVLKLCLASLLAAGMAVAQNPSADVLKQVLNKKLQKLIPSGFTERQVLFQDVRAGTRNGGSYPFMVTAIMRDYGSGYPPNHYYGETCVSRFDQARFSLFKNEFGDWDVEGALTPSLDTKQCKTNPSAGASSIPLSSLTGSAAPAGNPPPAGSAAPANQTGSNAQGAASGGMTLGKYECWGNGQARLLLNFSVRSATEYIGSDGKPGTYSYDASTNRVTFKTGALNGVMPAGFYGFFYAPQGRPTLSFRSPRGSEASFCQLVR